LQISLQHQRKRYLYIGDQYKK